MYQRRGFKEKSGSLDALQVSNRPLVDDITGIQRGSRLEQHDPTLFFGNRTVLNPTWNDDEFAFIDPLLLLAAVLVPRVHAKAALHDQEHFIFMIMMMPDEWTIEFYQLNHLSVEFGRNVRLVGFGNLHEFFGDVDFLHNSPRVSNC